MHGSRKLCQRGSNSTFLLDKGERIQIPLIIGPLAKRHFKWRFAGRPMLARHVMLAWYMFSFEIFYGIWTSIDKKTIFLWFSRGGGSGPPVPPLWIRSWLDCFHQQTELCPYWVTLSGGIRNITWRQILKWNKQLMISRKANARSSCHRLRVTAGWPSDVHTILWALQRHRTATLRAPYDYRKSVRSFLGQDDNLKPCVVLTIIVRCPYGDHTMSLRCVYGLRAYDFFSNLSLCGVKQNRRGHDARKSVRWSQGLPAEAVRKRWYGHRTGIVYS